jgi:hypothetical protein
VDVGARFRRANLCGKRSMVSHAVRASSVALLIGMPCYGLGCGSATQRCRAGAAFQTDPVLRELALSRCEQVANREYAESVRQDEHDRAQRQERRRAAAIERVESASRREANEQQRGAVRASPRSPELGATLKESRSICKQQGGRHLSAPGSGTDINIRCVVGSSAIYKARIDSAEQVIVRLTVFFEGADLSKMRESLQTQFGAAAENGVRGGYRYWAWRASDSAVRLSSYAAGVSIVFDRALFETEKPAVEVSSSTVASESAEDLSPASKTEDLPAELRCSFARPCPPGLECDFGSGMCTQ